MGKRLNTIPPTAPPLPVEEEVTSQPEAQTDSIEHKLAMMEKGEEEQKSVEQIKKEEESEVCGY